MSSVCYLEGPIIVQGITGADGGAPGERGRSDQETSLYLISVFCASLEMKYEIGCYNQVDSDMGGAYNTPASTNF